MAERHAPSGRVRIIGGALRGSRLDVPDRPGLRPTPDRVRETLFNWLQPVLPGARCLDAFAGTGALALEAASRGAASVLALERDPALAKALSGAVARLGAKAVEVQSVDALAWLARAPDRRFDLVFLDPPFADGLWDAAMAAIVPWLAVHARVYVEAAPDAALNVPGWQLLREGRTRDLRYALYEAGPRGEGPPPG